MKFLVDEMLGDVARWLRLLGFDTVYAHDLIDKYGVYKKNGKMFVPDDTLIQFCFEEGRILITRDAEMYNRFVHLFLEKQNKDKRLYFRFFGDGNKEGHIDLEAITKVPAIVLKDKKIEYKIAGICGTFGITPKFGINPARCPGCNSELVKIKDKRLIKDRVPPKVYSYHDEFWKCSNPKCGKIYWIGGHFDMIKNTLKRAAVLMESKRETSPEEDIER